MYRALGTPAQTEHPFNLYGDIASQPDALRGHVRARRRDRRRGPGARRPRHPGIIGLGSGTSQFVAQVANAAFARFAGIPGWDYRLAGLPALHAPDRLVAARSSSPTRARAARWTRSPRRDACRDAGRLRRCRSRASRAAPSWRRRTRRILTAGGFDTGGSDTFHYTTRIARGHLPGPRAGPPAARRARTTTTGCRPSSWRRPT